MILVTVFAGLLEIGKAAQALVGMTKAGAEPELLAVEQIDQA